MERLRNIFIIQQNKRNVKDRSFSRKIESERSFLIPLKRIFIMTFWRADSMCSRKAILWITHKGQWKNLARQVSFCWKLKRSRITPTPPSMCPQTHTPIAIYNILYTSEICKHYMAFFKMPSRENKSGWMVIAETFGFTDALYSRVIFSNSRINDLISVLETFSNFK